MPLIQSFYYMWRVILYEVLHVLLNMHAAYLT
jgi:hypothetical protein